MLDFIMGWYQLVLDYAKPWPAAQAAIVTTSSVALAGGVGFVLWKFPQRIVNFFKQQLMTRLSFSTASTNWSEYNSQQYLAFLRWFSKNSWFGWSRIVTLDGLGSKGSIGPGVGTHFFVYRRRFYFFTIAEDSANQSNQAKYRITISTLGRSKGPIYRLMEAFMDTDDRESQVAVFENAKSDWNWISRMNKRDIDTIIMSDTTREELIGSLLKWKDSREWYAKRGLNYKFTVLLYGPPGTGKSSLAAAIASMLDRDIHILRPDGSCSYNSLFQSARRGLVLIEDIDTYAVARKRNHDEVDTKLGVAKKIVERSRDESPAPADAPESPRGMVYGTLAETNETNALDEYLGGSLSDLLNGLDGVLGLDDVVVLMTTNHPEKLDGALIRDGRVDVRVEIPFLHDTEIRRYIELMYPGEAYVAKEVFNPLPGATIQRIFKTHSRGVQHFVEGLYEEAKLHLELVA